RHDEERRQERSLRAEQLRQVLGRRGDAHPGLEPAADQALRAGRLEGLGHLAADLEQAAPLARQRVVEPLARRLREALEVDALARLMAPILTFTAEEAWRHVPGVKAESEGAEDVV